MQTVRDNLVRQGSANRIWLPCIIALFTIGLPCGARANLITNGSFEFGSFVVNFVPPGASVGIDRLPSNSTAITGWTVGPSPAGVDWNTAPDALGFDGTKSVDLTGVNAAGDGSISTIFPTNIGSQYHITFDAYGGNQTQSGVLSAGSLVNQSSTAAGVPQASAAVYAHFSFDFIATGANSTLTFASVNSNGFGPVIDNAVVTFVPEPSSLALLCANGLMLLRRRKNSAARHAHADRFACVLITR